ncbi:MAG: (Fe-S)-binding protein [Gammaproteobacteria bacterium]
MFDFMDFDGGTESYSSPAGPSVPEPADCMRCGLCLSYCPTYRLTHDEQEGPRQRIRTLSRWVLEQQEVGSEAIEHLQNCLQCRACEAVCPSKMDFSLLFDRAQGQLAVAKKNGLYAKMALRLIADKPLFNRMVPLVKLYRSSGLRYLLTKLKILEFLGLSRADKIAPLPVSTALKTRYPVSLKRGTVALFTGCIGDRFDRETLTAAIKVLNRIGFEVLVPKRQACCGAIHYHNGEQETAKRLMKKNLDVFSEMQLDAIIYCATGCGSQLMEYPRIFEDIDAHTASTFHDKLFEISEFVERQGLESMSFKPCRQKASVHEPCNQRNVLKNQQAVYRLLQKIPALEVNELADNHLCCGAGGSYMLTHPENADALRDLKWNQVEKSPADYLVTTNIGCALHLATAQQAGRAVEILHPITLIARHLN